MNTINTRKADIIKTCKYHYKHDTLGTVEILRRVVAVHNGVALEYMNDSVLFHVLLADTVDLVLRTPADASKLLNGYLSSADFDAFNKRMTGDRDAKNVGSTALLMLEYIGMVTWIAPELLEGGTLPPNCPIVEQAVILPENY